MSLFTKALSEYIAMIISLVWVSDCVSISGSKNIIILRGAGRAMSVMRPV